MMTCQNTANKKLCQNRGFLKLPFFNLLKQKHVIYDEIKKKKMETYLTKENTIENPMTYILHF